MPPSRIESLVRHFVGDLESVIRDEIRGALEHRFVGDGAGRRASNGHGRAKGEKRAPEEIEALEAKLVDFIRDHPGLRVEELNRELGTETKDLMLPIRKLIAARKLKTTGQRRATRYALAGSGGAKGKRKKMR